MVSPSPRAAQVLLEVGWENIRLFPFPEEVERGPVVGPEGGSVDTPEGVEHWHGAHPDEAALQLTIYGGTVNWLEPVEDAVYRAPSRRR